MIPRLALLALASTILLVPPAIAALPDSLSYALNTPPSQLESGCQGPCKCAVFSEPTYGSFDLIRTGGNASAAAYEIHRYIASFNNGPGAVSLVGTGTYQIDTAAGTQRMTLDLDVWGEPEHFDSGVVPLSAPFPQIHAACAVHGFACMDSVIVVDAVPLEQVGAPPAAPHVGLLAAWPDPFVHSTSLWLDLGRTGTADLRIVDAAGRVVRVLAGGTSFGAGPRSLVWDGMNDRGQEVAPGVYWAVLRWAGGGDRRRLVKLD
jgi:flagellar hook capping protein FlgD